MRITALRKRYGIATLVCCVWLSGWSLPAVADLSSYATAAVDVVGTTGAAAEALGVPDYHFVNDVGLGFGGTSSEVFAVGESVDLSFPVPIRDVAGQHDVILSAFVGGLGATDNATVQVEASTDGTNFTLLTTFDTEEARDRSQDRWENDFEGVKHFFIEFGGLDFVTHIRLTNLSGTAEGLRLDAVEGLHPDVASTHAFEIRFDRYRPDFNSRFFVRVKNIGDPGSVPIREIRMTRSTLPLATLEDTDDPLFGVDGDFICVEHCIPDNGPLIPFTRYAWSVDGTVEAPPGVGLEPGRQAASSRNRTFDTDNIDFLSGMTFRVTFTDGLVHDFDYDNDVMKDIGSLYQKYLYFSDTPSESWNRPTYYYEFVAGSAAPVPALSPVASWLLVAAAALSGVGLLHLRARRRSQAG